MRRFMGMAAIAGMAALAAACAANGADAGDQTMGQRSFAASGFDKIALGGSQRVVVTVGGAASVRAEGPQAALDRLEIGVEDGALRIGNRSGSWSSGSDRQPVTVHVTLPSLSGASVGGSGMISVNRVEGQRFNGSVGGSGSLLIEQLRVAEAEFSVGGSGSINASGAVQQLHANLGGSGGLDFGGLEARQANLSVAGSGNVAARASETANVSLAGSGNVSVIGNARCNVERHGPGRVSCGNQG